MNNTRRKELEKICCRLREVQADIELFQGEEEDAFDNLPEGIQDSERGETMEDAISQMEDACALLQETIEALEAAKGE